MQSINNTTMKSFNYTNSFKGVLGETQVRTWLNNAFPDIELKDHKIWESGLDIVGFVPSLNWYIVSEVVNWDLDNYPSKQRIMSIVRNLSDFSAPSGSTVTKFLIAFGARPTSETIRYLGACGIVIIRMACKPYSPNLRNPFKVDGAVVDSVSPYDNKTVLDDILQASTPEKAKEACMRLLTYLVQFSIVKILSGDSARSDGDALKLQSVEPPTAKNLCPYCGSPGRKCPLCNGWMVCFGHYRSKQRFRCKACKKTISVEC